MQRRVLIPQVQGPRNACERILFTIKYSLMKRNVKLCFLNNSVYKEYLCSLSQLRYKWFVCLWESWAMMFSCLVFCPEHYFIHLFTNSLLAETELKAPKGTTRFNRVNVLWCHYQLPHPLTLPHLAHFWHKSKHTLDNEGLLCHGKELVD